MRIPRAALAAIFGLGLNAVSGELLTLHPAGAAPRAAQVDEVPSGCNGTPAPTDAARNQPPVSGTGTAHLTTPTAGPVTAPPAGPTAASSALLATASSDLAVMTTSRYVHRSLPYPDPRRVYDTDCSGFVSFLVNQTTAATASGSGRFAPLSDLVTITSGPPVAGSQPRAKADQFAELFGALASGVVRTDRYWAGIGTVDALRQGDLIAWVTNPGSSSQDTGHVMVVAGAPTLGPPMTHAASAPCPALLPGSAVLGPGSQRGPVGNYAYRCPGGQTIDLFEYDVPIVDQSGPHGPGVVPGLNATPPDEVAPGSDTRNANPRNGPISASKPHSGLGAGVLGLLTLAPGGTPVGDIWYPSGSPNPVFYVMAGSGGAGTCAPGFVVPRSHETTPFVRHHHLRCIQGIAFGRLLATR